MNRTNIASRVSKLEAATRATGRVHTIDARYHNGDRDKAQEQFEAGKAALIASGKAGPDDLFVCFATFYEPKPAQMPDLSAATSAPPVIVADERTYAERMERLSERTAALMAGTAPPAAERPRDLLGTATTKTDATGRSQGLRACIPRSGANLHHQEPWIVASANAYGGRSGAERRGT